MTHIKTVGTMGLAWSISVHSYGIPKNLVALAMRGSSKKVSTLDIYAPFPYADR